MKKRLLSLVLVLTLVMSFGMNAFATDPAVQAAYDAYGKMKTAMESKDLEALRAAAAEFENCVEELTEEQEEALSELAGEELIEVILTAATVTGMADAKDAFMANKNASTATFYADNYKLLVLDEEWGADTAALIKDMIPDGQSVYEEAQAYLPAEHVMKVYEAYTELQFALMIQSYDDDFKAACDGFEAILDIYNELTEEEMNQLASLLELKDGDEAYGNILADWITANVVLQMGEVFDAYLDTPSEETAKAFVEYYDSLYNDPEYADEELRAVIEEFFGAIHEVYAEAKAFGSDDDTTGEEDGIVENEEETDVEVKQETDKEASPKTGDAASVILPLACMLAAAVVVMTKKRRA